MTEQQATLRVEADHSNWTEMARCSHTPCRERWREHRTATMHRVIGTVRAHVGPAHINGLLLDLEMVGSDCPRCDIGVITPAGRPVPTLACLTCGSAKVHLPNGDGTFTVMNPNDDTAHRCVPAAGARARTS